ncbi:uncharacterized protein BYT42DRAFT_609489 [Radiomyces spectabilis]|uniref:uncharacterized protein n=1 Tax=Radiomyces spectabilis TaxID=64574 RepID=UPI00221FCD56|nr:uncharacterized protein BYT42DRAFT_609489 [Radiomyces spectabilis]KAI8393718.1 hypothetical protein BYT42DRAFT_609489 [Radiomyces spectabilis]
MKWLPLPKIAHGIAIYPFTPSAIHPSPSTSTSRPPTTYSTLYSPLLSPQTDTASIHTTGSSSSYRTSDHCSANAADYSHLIPLEVGDELFIFEQQDAWYRGYVVCALEEGRKPNAAPIGCFPRSHVQIKEYLDIDPNEGDTVVIRRPDSGVMDTLSPSLLPELPSLARSFSESHIQTPLKIKQEELIPARPGSLGDLGLEFDASTTNPMYSGNNSTTPTNLKHRHFTPPPLPLARFDQSTVTGVSEPLIDEIGACVSEWNSMLYTYLQQSKYTSFKSVRDHINYLFQARRQLLDQALSREELARLRKEIIYKMVIMNLSQNKEIIIRHPERGYLLDANTASLATLYRMHWKYANLEHAATTQSFSSSPTSAYASSRFSLTDASSPTRTSSHSTSFHDPFSSSASMSSSSTNLTGGTPSAAAKGAKFHHLFFELKACIAHICQPGEHAELYFSLYTKAEKKFVTEQFVVILNDNGMPKDESQIGKLQTLFADLSAHDLNDQLYLVCRVVRLGGMKFVDKEKDHLGTIGSHASMIFGSGDSHRMMSYFENAGSQRNPSSSSTTSTVTSSSHLCRRPFGCAVLHLGPLLQKPEQDGGLIPSSVGWGSVSHMNAPNVFTPTGAAAITTTTSMHQQMAEHDIRIYTAASESSFATLHEDIINNNVKEFTKHPRAEALCVYLRMFYGQLDDVLKTNAAILADVPRTARLGFPDVVFPDDERNELYITLQSGDFAQFGRSRNIQLTLCVRDNISGEPVENALSAGAGAPSTTYWDSIILYHDQRPKWAEMVKVKISDLRLWERSHVFITVKHRSSYGTATQSGTGAASRPSGDHTPTAGTGVSSTHDKIIAIGFLPLFLPPLHRDFIADGSHTLYLYKYDRQLPHPSNYIDAVPWCYRSSSPSNMQAYENTNGRANQPRARVGHQNSQSGSFKGSIGNHTAGGFSSSSIFHYGSNNNSNTSIQDVTSSGTNTPTVVAGKLSTVRDTLTLTTFLCSTRFTQNKTLVKLLNWRSLLNEDTNDAEELLAVLDKFTFVGEMEVVKFLGDIFDALLDILAFRHDNVEMQEKLNDQALAAMIWVLGIVQDRRFSNFRPVLDVYIDHRFSTSTSNASLSSSDDALSSTKPRYLLGKVELTCDEMLKGMLRLCANPGDPRKAKRLRSSMKVWDYLFRFIVRSRLLQQQNEEEGERGLRDIMFKDELQQLLDLITQIMNPDQPNAMIGTQTLALQHFADILTELRRIFSSRQLVEIATKFVDACSHVTGKLVGFKLCMILAIVKGPVFNDSTCRSGLAKNVFKWVKMWLNSYMAVAKDVIFSLHNDGNDQDHYQQTRLPRVQWLENLRLSLTIMSEVLDKVRKSCGMSTSGLSSSTISSPSLSTISRPISMATSGGGDDETLDEPQVDLMTITEIALQLLPQLLNCYKDLQRLVRQAVQASGMPYGVLSTGIETSHPLSRPSSSRNSLNVLRERGNSFGQKTSNVGDGHEGGGSKFSVVLQALATSPISPFPSSYPFQSSNSKNTLLSVGNDLAAMVTTGLLDLTVVLLELFYLTPRQQWVCFLRSMHAQEGTDATAEFLRKVCHVCSAILFGDDFQILESSSGTMEGLDRCEDDTTKETRKLPHQWLNLDIISHQIVLCNILAPVIDIFEMEAFIPPLDESDDPPTDSATLRLWKTFFVTFLRAISSHQLEIETYLPQSQRAIWKIAGNMKGAVGARTLLTLWALAGPKHGRSDEHRRPELLAYFGRRSTYEPIAEEEQPASVDEEKKEAKSSPMSEPRPSSTASDPDALALKMMVGHIRNDRSRRRGDRLSQLHPRDSNLVPTPEVSFLQIDLMPIIVRPLCAASLTHHDRMRSAAIQVIADIITIELSLGELPRVTHLLIGTMDRLVMSENKGNETIVAKMIPELEYALSKKLHAQNTDHLIETSKQTVESLRNFLELLLQIRSLPMDNDEFMDERINATLKLMKFIQVIEREEIYIKYVHQLVQLHVDSHNYVEAALTLRFHADLLRWDPYEELEVLPDLDFPQQSSFERKEALYWTMISYLERGSAWEISVQLCKELAHEYEYTVFNYHKLSEVLQRQAKLVQDIVEKERYFTEYFRVGFYGRGFPASVRNHQFIYRGLEWEKMSSFVERMQNRHPNAQLLSGKLATAAVLPEDQLRELESGLDEQYLQITAVIPEPAPGSVSDDASNTKHALASDNIKKYYQSNEVSRFTFSRPVHKGTQPSVEDASKPESDFLNLWTEKAVLVCEESFPTIARRSKIVSITVKEVSPIENAVVAMENKNRELEELQKKYMVYVVQSRPPSGPININPFSMALNGAVDAPVNGGVPLYKKAFLTTEYWEQHPDMRPWIGRLRAAIDDQVRIISDCLDTHSKIVSPEMRPFHNTLIDFFKKNFAQEIKRMDQAKHTEEEGSSSRKSSAKETSERIPLVRQGSSAQLHSPSLTLPMNLPMSPISRAFSICTPVTETPPPFDDPVEHGTMSRAESISRSLKMSLRKKSRKRSISAAVAANNMKS